VSDRLEELVEETVKGRCEDLQREEKDGKVLFFCKEELIGSVVPMEGFVAGTVYSEKFSDPIHKEFLSKVKERFKEKVKEAGTKLSGGIDQNFYYTYVHVKL